MKKRNNKVIILVLVGIIFIVSFGIFILNYSKDDSSFSILEKKWINDNKSNVLDISVYNDVPVYGKNGKGVIFDFLDTFTEKYEINFNRVSYHVDNNNNNMKDIAFRIIDDNNKLTDNDILMYTDGYVLVTSEEVSIDKITDLTDENIGVLSTDIALATNYLSDAKNIKFTPKSSISELKEALESKEIQYFLLPYNTELDFIFENNLNILFHINDINKKYVLTVQNKTLLNIMKKFYLQYTESKEKESYKENYLDEFFTAKEISEVERMGYNSSSYNVGYITYMPYESTESGEFVGILSNYLSGFEDLFDVDFKLYKYNSIEEMKTALSHGELDLIFSNFDVNGTNVDKIYTKSPFKEEYVVLAKDNFTISSIKSLQGKEVLLVKDSYLNTYINSNNINFKGYDNTDELLRNINNSSVLILDKDTYIYYQNKKLANYKVLYTGVLPYEYKFVIRDVDKNTLFAKMFDTYVSKVDYEAIKFDYNTNASISNINFISILLIILAIIIITFIIVIIVMRKKKKDLLIKNNDKLKYIDSMTSLKNRAYLNQKIKEWDDNVIYPQAFVVIDLNNIKDINDNHGHEEGDMVIKKAASILIVNQEANTDIIRTDGNEFLVYMVGYDEKSVSSYVRMIYKELKDLPYGYGAAIGYSMIMDDVKTVDDAINEATLDMRNKKENI